MIRYLYGNPFYRQCSSVYAIEIVGVGADAEGRRAFFSRHVP